MTIPARNEMPAQFCWDLTALYRSQEDWERELEQFERDLPTISAYRGRLGTSAATLREALEASIGLKRLADKLYTYARFNSDVDTANATNLGHLQRITNLIAQMTAHASFIRPEILAIETARLEEFLQDPQLADLVRLIREMVRYRDHTLSHDEERLLAMGIEVFDTAEKVFSQLNNADLQFGSVVVDGKEVGLSHATFSSLLRNPNRAVREEAFTKYYSVFDGHRNTISATLTASIQKDSFLARAKRFKSSIEKALFSDNVEASVYDNLIATISRNLEPLHRYYGLRKKLLKLEDQRIFDTYVQLVPNIDTKTPYEEAVSMVLDSLQPLGETYTAALAKGLREQRWVDVYENRGKRSGAYSGGCYDSFPYILLNYIDEDLRQVFTLTHEAGHSMHSYLSRQNQQYQDSFYTIFVAEVASTFNEQLLTRYLKDRHANNRSMVAYLVNQQIDDIKATLYRQTMFAEFEQLVHRLGEENRPLTIEVYRELYGRLLQKYFGDSVSISRLDELEFLRIPHFYSSFYVYKYATGISAAISLSQQVLNGGKTELQRYLSFLGAGCSKYPLELLRDAGVDMTTPLPIETACALFGSLVDELESLLA